MELKCEFKDCPEVKKGADIGQCIDLMKLHHAGHHATGAPAAAVVKNESKERRAERAKMKLIHVLET